MQYLIFNAAGHLLALDVLKIDELVLSKNFSIKDLDSSQRIKRDNTDYAIYDLSPDIIATDRPFPNKYTIILCKPGRPLGLIADNAEEIVTVNEEQISPVDTASPAVDKNYLDGVIEQDNKKIHIISFEKLSKLITARQ